MHLIFNELSVYPIAKDSYTAESKIEMLLKTYKSASNRYDIKHIRFPENYACLPITENQSFLDLISNLVNRDIKNLILSICIPPFVDDLEERDLCTFINSKYSISDPNVPTNESPIGLPVAYIKSWLAISLTSDIFWQKRKICVNKIPENIMFETYNICLDTDIDSAEISEWADKSMPDTIISEDILRVYLGYTKYGVNFKSDFLEQLFEWKSNNFDTFKSILLLMKDVQLHPFSGGMGQTENLKNRGKEASKRISLHDRLSYMIENNAVTFIACKGHYDFH